MISLLCPTRNRPHNVRRLIQTALDTCSEVIDFVFYCDDDAPKSVPYDVRQLVFVQVVDGPRITLSDCWNKCWEKAAGDIYMLCGDDVQFRSRGWDIAVQQAIDQFPDRLAYVYGDDGYHGGNLATHGFVHRNWTDVIGRFTAPYFSSDYPDTWLHDVAHAAGRLVYLPEVFIEHMHPVAHKAGWDDTYEEKAQRHQRDDPATTYYAKQDERLREVVLLKKAMGML